MIDPVSTDPFSMVGIEDWLADPEGAVIFHEPQPPAIGYSSFLAAVVEAQGHERCPSDGRKHPMVLIVTGKDGAVTLQRVEVGVNVHCVLGVLNRDDEVTSAEVIGVEIQ